MRLRPDQMQSQLDKELAPVYLVSGDEPFQLEQVSNAIRVRAQAQGHTDREIMHVDRSFDWQQLSASADALSLFAEKRLLELRLPTGKPGDAGGKALVRYCDNPPPDTVLLIVELYLMFRFGRLGPSSLHTGRYFFEQGSAGGGEPVMARPVESDRT